MAPHSLNLSNKVVLGRVLDNKRVTALVVLVNLNRITLGLSLEDGCVLVRINLAEPNTANEVAGVNRVDTLTNPRQFRNAARGGNGRNLDRLRDTQLKRVVACLLANNPLQLGKVTGE